MVCHQHRRGVAQLCDVLWFHNVSLWGSISALTCGCVAVRSSWPFLMAFLTCTRAWFWLSGIRPFSENFEGFCLGLFGFFPTASNVWWVHRGCVLQSYHTAGVVERDWTSYMVMELLCPSTVSSQRCLILLPVVSARFWSVLGYLPFIWFGGCTGIEVTHSCRLSSRADWKYWCFCVSLSAASSFNGGQEKWDRWQKLSRALWCLT